MDVNADLMIPNPITVHATAPIATCARRMAKHGIRHLPVVAPTGAVIGVVTDVEVYRHGSLVGRDDELWVPYEESEAGLQAAHVLTPIAVTAHPQGALMPTLRRLIDSDQDFVAIVDDDGHLQGIITEHDGVRLAAEVLRDLELPVLVESQAPVEVADRYDPAYLVLQRMQLGGFRHMVLVESQQPGERVGAPGGPRSGRITGVVSMGDLLADDVAQRRHMTADDVVRSLTVHTINASETLHAAAEAMMKHRIGCLPVVDQHMRPHRILTRTDLMEAAVVALEQRAVFPDGSAPA